MCAGAFCPLSPFPTTLPVMAKTGVIRVTARGAGPSLLEVAAGLGKSLNPHPGTSKTHRRSGPCCGRDHGDLGSLSSGSRIRAGEVMAGGALQDPSRCCISLAQASVVAGRCTPGSGHEGRIKKRPLGLGQGWLQGAGSVLLCPDLSRSVSGDGKQGGLKE